MGLLFFGKIKIILKSENTSYNLEVYDQFQLSVFVGKVLPVRFVKHPGRPASDESATDDRSAFELGIPEGLGSLRGIRADMDLYHPEKNRDAIL